MKGVLTYWVEDGKDRMRSVRFTVCSEDDGTFSGSMERRRGRLLRILGEAEAQGVKLSYNDLAMITLASRATLKRDLRHFRDSGYSVPVGRQQVQVEVTHVAS